MNLLTYIDSQKQLQITTQNQELKQYERSFEQNNTKMFTYWRKRSI
jgi:hypothetical protein